MDLRPLSSGSKLLHKLVAEYLGGKIDTARFCSDFEQTYNFDVGSHELTAKEDAIFARLFNEVVYFSPYREDRVIIPQYRSEEQIRSAAKTAEAELSTDS
jgi:hypothetical protein